MVTYLDSNGTTKISAAAKREQNKQSASYNPSSTSKVANKAKDVLATTKETILEHCGVTNETHQVIFTSGGSEGNSFAIIATALAAWRHSRSRSLQESTTNLPHIVASAIEHHSVIAALENCHHWGICNFSLVQPNVYGQIVLDAVKDAVNANTCLISVMAANNETGAINPIQEIGEYARSAGIPFHCDCVPVFPRFRILIRDPKQISGSSPVNQENDNDSDSLVQVNDDLEAIEKMLTKLKGKSHSDQNDEPITGSGIEEIDDLMNTMEFEESREDKSYNDVQPVYKTDDPPKKGTICSQLHGKSVETLVIPAEIVTASAHKFGGSKGTGFIVIHRRFRDAVKLKSIICGSQNETMRGGTENIAGIAALNVALKETFARRDKINSKLAKLVAQTLKILSDRKFTIMDYETYIKRTEYDLKGENPSYETSTKIVSKPTQFTWGGLQKPFIMVYGPPSHHHTWRLPNTLLISIVTEFRFCNVELKKYLDERGIVVGISSACLSNSDSASHVVNALHVSPEIRQGTLRISFPDDATEASVKKLTNALMSGIMRQRNQGEIDTE